MQGRLLVLVVLAVTVAGCGGTVPSSSSDDRATVTPLPVPEPTEPEAGIAGVGDGTVDGGQLGETHAASLDDGYTRVVDFTVIGPAGRHLAYRGARTVDATDDVLLRRDYRGPWAARFVPDSTTASRAESVRYRIDGRTGQRRTVDGTTARPDRGEAPPLEPPVPPLDDAALVAALLENATVAERTESGGVRLTGGSVRSSVVPAYADAPRNVSVRATVRGSGRVTHIFARYEATVGGEPVVVTQNVYWSPPSEPVVAPEWADGP